MRAISLFKSAMVASACVFALALAVGCSSGAASGSTSAAASSASAESAAASAASDASAASAESAAAASTEGSAEASAAASTEAASDASAASAESGQFDEATAAKLGFQVFEGTVHVCTAEELVELQKADIDPAIASGGGTYAVLAFDQATKVTGMSGDGTGERTETSNMLGIAEYTKYDSFVVEYGDLDTWKSLDGQHVAIAAQADKIMFPSDVRLPIGEPSASDVKLLS